MTDKQLIIILGVAALGIWYAKSKAVAAVEGAAEAIDITDPDNIFHTGVNKIGGSLSNNPDFSLGSWVFDVFNGENAGLE